MRPLVQRELARLSEALATGPASEGLFAIVQVLVFYQVLITGELPFAQVADVPVSLEMVTVDVALEVELGVVGLVTSRSHAAIQHNQVFRHYLSLNLQHGCERELRS